MSILASFDKNLVLENTVRSEKYSLKSSLLFIQRQYTRGQFGQRNERHLWTLQWRQRRQMSAMASQITSLTIVNSTVYSGQDQRKHRSSLAFMRGIHRWPANSPHKGPVTRKMLPFDDVIMNVCLCHPSWGTWERLDCLVSLKETKITGARFLTGLWEMW